MKKIKIASPLFIVREDAQKDLFGTLEKIAAYGFDGVEFVGFFGKEPKEIRAKLDELGLIALGNHVPLAELCENPEQVIENHKILGCKYITIGWPSRDMNSADAAFTETVGQMAAAAEKIKAAGLTPLYHNHDFEFWDCDGIAAIFSVCKEKGLQFEPDLGWIAFTGTNPAVYLEKYKDICPVIHLKDIYLEDVSKVGRGDKLSDIPCDPERGAFAFRPTGYGNINIPALLPLCIACEPEWFVADHDCAYAGDAYEELGLSLSYIQNLLKIY